MAAVCSHAEQFAAAADVYAAKKHGLQELAIEKAKADWYAQYTDEKGVVTVPAADLETNLARMKASDNELAESRRQWAHAAQQFRDTLALTRRSLETLKDKDARLQAKKADLAAALNAALATLVGAAGGAAL
jgi:septal ring factor EnvC (AmiA/AmiB activator)